MENGVISKMSCFSFVEETIEYSSLSAQGRRLVNHRLVPSTPTKKCKMLAVLEPFWPVYIVSMKILFLLETW